MRQYETAFLITPKLEEEEREKLIESMAEVVKKKKGKMVNIEKWGKRKLAYPIDKLEEAVYVFFHYQGSPDIPHELQRRFRQTESILRYLTLKKETQAPMKQRTKPSGKSKTKTEDDKVKSAEEKAGNAKKTEEPKEESLEQALEAPPEEKEPESEKPDEEKK